MNTEELHRLNAIVAWCEHAINDDVPVERACAGVHALLEAIEQRPWENA